MIDVNHILKLPDDEGYRLINSKQIKRKGTTFVLSLIFQRVPNARSYFKEVNFNPKKAFVRDRTWSVEVNIAYARIFVIGSIWFRSGSERASLPNYLRRYSINENILETGTVSSRHITRYLKSDSRPLVDNEKDSYAHLIAIELQDSLYHNKAVKKIVPLQSRTEWNEAPETNFIAFYSYELYRYFLTGEFISDVNERMLYQGAIDSPSPYQLIYKPTDDEKKKLSPEDRFPVFLIDKNHEPSVEQIGNCVYLENYKKALNGLKAAINTKKFDGLEGLTEFPIAKFSNLKFSASRVTRFDGVKGLLVHWIHECHGYRDFEYTPIIIENSKVIENSGYKGKSVGLIGKTDEDQVEVPKYAVGTVSNQSNNEESLYFPGFELGLGMKGGKKNRPTIKLNISNGKPNYYPQENHTGSGPPGANPENSKNRKPVRGVDLFNYFEIFEKIVLAVASHARLKQYGNYQIQYASLEDDGFHFQPECSKIQTADIKNLVQIGNYAYHLYVVKISIACSHFYLFEKAPVDEKNEIIPSQGRTWLFSQKPKGISIDKELLNKLKLYLKWKKNRTNEMKALKTNSLISHRFNHNHEMIVKVDGKNEKKRISAEQAIEWHSDKIAKQISSAISV